MKERVEVLRFLTAIWGMVAAASFIAALFDKAGMYGVVVGIFATYMGVRAVKRMVQADKEVSL